MYQPKAPPVELLVDKYGEEQSLTPRQTRRKHGEVVGYPGDRIG